MTVERLDAPLRGGAEVPSSPPPPPGCAEPPVVEGMGAVVGHVLPEEGAAPGS
jgi:hypothetical protein